MNSQNETKKLQTRPSLNHHFFSTQVKNKAMIAKKNRDEKKENLQYV